MCDVQFGWLTSADSCVEDQNIKLLHLNPLPHGDSHSRTEASPEREPEVSGGSPLSLWTPKEGCMVRGSTSQAVTSHPEQLLLQHPTCQPFALVHWSYTPGDVWVRPEWFSNISTSRADSAVRVTHNPPPPLLPHPHIVSLSPMWLLLIYLTAPPH